MMERTRKSNDPTISMIPTFIGRIVFPPHKKALKAEKA